MGCGGSKSKAKAAAKAADAPTAEGEKKALALTDPMEKVDFKTLGIPEVDKVFENAQVLITSFGDINEKIIAGVAGLMKTSDNGGSAGESDALIKTMKEAIVGAQACVAHVLPSNVDEIRKKVASNDMAGAGKMVATELPKLKGLLPKVDLSGISKGTVDIALPTDFKLDVLSGGAKQAMDMVMGLFETFIEICKDALPSAMGKMEEMYAQVKELTPSKMGELAGDAVKEMGMMDKAKFLKAKAGELKENSALTTKIKDFSAMIVKKAQLLGPVFVNAFTEALKHILQYAPKSAAVGDAEPKGSV